MSASEQTVEIPCILEDGCLEILKKAGVQFVRDDLSCKNEREREERRLPLLQRVRLPSGWSLKVSGNCEKRLYDAQGRTRAKMFHKGAFWDTRADMRACGRFHIICEAYGAEPRLVFTVRDGDEDGPIVFTSSPYQRHSSEERAQFLEEDEAESKRALDECEHWLDANYPNWRDRSAYWD